MRLKLLLFFIFIGFPLVLYGEGEKIFKERPSFFITNVEYQLQLISPEKVEAVYFWDTNLVKQLKVDKTGKFKLKFSNTKSKLKIEWKNGKYTTLNFRIIPGYLSILPPIVAILMAFLFKDVILSLLVGILMGGFFVYDYNLWTSFLRLTDRYILNSLTDTSHVSIIVFSLTLGGMIGIISSSGGAAGIVKRLAKFVKDFRSGQLVSWLMGVLIFFDDYANTLLVGNTMRPLTDKLRISREKLAYIVDSTSAPVASLFVISTWIGFEIGQVDKALNLVPSTLSVAAYYKKVGAFIMFLESIPFRFYAFFALFLVFLVAYLGRDFGPMYEAEVRARRDGKVLRDGAKPLSSLDKLVKADKDTHWLVAFIPIITLILFVIGGLWFTGKAAILAKGGEAAWQKAKLYQVLANSDSFSVLLWASLFSSIVAVVVSVFSKSLTISESVSAWVEGIKSMILAMIIMTLSWALSSVCGDLKTSYYITEIARGILSPYYLPVLVFFIAAFVSFSTGTSWGTMGILLPLVLPVSFHLTTQLPSVYINNIVLGTLAAVLSGAVFGDHCSPISDTTIMSSMSSGCDHIDHVKTQLPYALLSGLIAAGAGFLLIGFGLSPYLSLLIGALLLVFIFLFLSKSTGKEIFLDSDINNLRLEDSINYLDKDKWLTQLKKMTILELDKNLNLLKENLTFEELFYFLKKNGWSDWQYFYLLRKLISDDLNEDKKQELSHFLQQVYSLDLSEKGKIEVLLLAEKIIDKSFLEFFVKIFNEESPRVKASAVLILARNSGEKILPLLTDVIEKEEGRVRANAIEALLYLNRVEPDKLKKIVLPYIKDSNFRVRCNVKRLLFKLEKDKEKIIFLLREDYREAKTLNDKLSIIYTLSLLDDISGFKELITILEKEKEPECKAKIIDLLKKRDKNIFHFFFEKFLKKGDKEENDN